MHYLIYKDKVKEQLLNNVHNTFYSYKNNDTSESELEKFIDDTLQEFEVLKNFDDKINKQFRLEKFEDRALPANEWENIKKEILHFLVANGHEEDDAVFDENDQSLEFHDYYIIPAKYLDERESILHKSTLNEVDGFAIYGSSAVYNYPNEPDDVDVFIIDFAEDHLEAAKIAVLDEARQKADNAIDLIKNTKIMDFEEERNGPS